MVRTMDEMRATRGGVQYPVPAESGPKRLARELDELDKVVNTISQVRATLADKARHLYTAEQVGDAQTSEAELVSAPLYQKIGELERRASERREEIRGLESLVSNQREQLDQAQGRISNMSEWLSTAQEDRDRLRGDLGLIKAERDAARARVADLEAREMELGLTAINEQLVTVKAQRDAACAWVAELEELASSRAEELEGARGWLALRDGELASANAQRDAERDRVKELNRMLALRLEEIKYLEAARTQAVEANRELIERGVAGVKVRDKVAELQQSLAARDSLLAKATAERDDYQAQLIEIRNVVMSDPIEQALTDHQTGKAILRHVNVLVGALLDVRSTVSVPDPDQPARPRIDQKGRYLLRGAAENLDAYRNRALIQDIGEYLRNGPTSPTGPLDRE